LPFKCNLQRYSVVAEVAAFAVQPGYRNEVGGCTLNQVDPYSIAYNLSNP
jgi:hypothetical protein